jgi:hypothetical protein
MTFYIKAATFLENLENLDKAVFFEKVMESLEKSWKIMAGHGKVMEIFSQCRTILQVKVNNIK